MLFLLAIWISFLSEVLLVNYDYSNNGLYSTNNGYYWNNDKVAFQRQTIHRKMPKWALLYNQLLENRDRNLKNSVNRNIVYPNPYINRVAAKPRTRQPQPLLNRSPHMKYFYNHKHDATVQAKPKQNLPIYIPDEGNSLKYPPPGASAPYYPRLTDLFQESFYADIAERRKKKYASVLQHFTGGGFLVKPNKKASFPDSFITPTKKDQITSYNFPTIGHQQQSPYFPYTYQNYQYRSQMIHPTKPSDTRNLQKFTLFPQNTVQRRINQNIKPVLGLMGIKSINKNAKKKENPWLRPFEQVQKTSRQIAKHLAPTEGLPVKHYVITAIGKRTGTAFNIPKSILESIYSKTAYLGNKRQKITRTANSKPQEWDKKDFIPRRIEPTVTNHLMSTQYKKNIIRQQTSPSTFNKSLTSNDNLKRDNIFNPINEKPENSAKRPSAVTTQKGIRSWKRRASIRHHVFHPIGSPMRLQEPERYSFPVHQTINTQVVASKRGILPYDSDDDRESDDDFDDDDGDIDGKVHDNSLPGDDREENTENLEAVSDPDEMASEDEKTQQKINQFASDNADPSDVNGIGDISNNNDLPNSFDEAEGEKNNSPLLGNKPTKDVAESLHQGMVQNIATARETVGVNNGRKKHSEFANDEEAEAALEDKEAQKLITSKDKYRMDDQPEILDINKNGISSTSSKESISANFANSLTQSASQDNRVGVDTTDPFINQQTFMKMQKEAEPMNLPEQEHQGIQEEDYHKSFPNFVQGEAKSSSPSAEPELSDENEENEDFKHLSPNVNQEENNIGNLDPMDIDNKNDEEKSALLDPEKAQERAIKLSAEREVQKKLAKSYDERSKHSDSYHYERIKDDKKFSEDIGDNLSAEEALNALNGGSLPSKKDSGKFISKEDSTPKALTNRITSPSTGITTKNPADLQPSHGQEESNESSKKTVADTDGNKKTESESKSLGTPVVANASVSTEVVNLLKSLGQIKGSPEKKEEDGANSVNKNTTKSTIDSEELETKEAVHDLGIAIGILEKKLTLINEAKATGDKKNIFIVDDTATRKTDKGAAAKSTIELGNSVRLLQKVMNVAERFQNKKNILQKNIANKKRNTISKLPSQSSLDSTRYYLNQRNLISNKPYRQSKESTLNLNPIYEPYMLKNDYNVGIPSWRKSTINQPYRQLPLNTYQKYPYIVPWYNDYNILPPEYRW